MKKNFWTFSRQYLSLATLQIFSPSHWGINNNIIGFVHTYKGVFTYCMYTKMRYHLFAEWSIPVSLSNMTTLLDKKFVRLNHLLHLKKAGYCLDLCAKFHCIRRSLLKTGIKRNNPQPLRRVQILNMELPWELWHAHQSHL